MSEAILEVEGLKKYFPVRGEASLFSRKPKMIQAVDDVSFQVFKGENFGLVGESGSGKTTTGKCCVRLIEPTSGVIKWKGQHIEKLSRREFRPLRLKMQMIFQNPYSSLDNLFTAQRTISEALEMRGIRDPEAQSEEIDKFQIKTFQSLNI